MIAPVVRPLESWARSSVNSDGNTSYTDVYYFLIFLGSLTFLHIISLKLDDSSIPPIIMKKDSDQSFDGCNELQTTDSTELSSQETCNGSSINKNMQL